MDGQSVAPLGTTSFPHPCPGRRLGV